MKRKAFKQVDDDVELCIYPQYELELKKIFQTEMENGFIGFLEDGRAHYKCMVSAEKAYLLQKIHGILRSEYILRSN